MTEGIYNIAEDDEFLEDVSDTPAAWFDNEGDEDANIVDLKDYDITASPNDFNINTIVDFVRKGIFVVPGFQRNYVWDIKRASKLIESLLVGLPIPQLFLYEEKRNSFLVVDGQQRLMSIFYFLSGRFPRREKRPALRRIMSEHKALPASILSDDAYFQKFNLSLKSKSGHQTSPFHGKNYNTLGEYSTVLDLRTVRNIVIKQNAPVEDRDSSVFEIFNRLNTGGVNLRPQEIRSSLYHSNFTELLHSVNVHPTWMKLTGLSDPDLHEKDVEILLRVFALVADGDSYKEPMSGFLNAFARKSRTLRPEQLDLARDLFISFFERVSHLSPEEFGVAGSGRFNIAVFEAVFRAACSTAFKARDPSKVLPVTARALASLRLDPAFLGATQYGIGRTSFVKERYERASAIIGKP